VDICTKLEAFKRTVLRWLLGESKGNLGEMICRAGFGELHWTGHLIGGRKNNYTGALVIS
jgi:hypothetical protein